MFKYECIVNDGTKKSHTVVAEELLPGLEVVEERWLMTPMLPVKSTNAQINSWRGCHWTELDTEADASSAGGGAGAKPFLSKNGEIIELLICGPNGDIRGRRGNG